jgi:two-component sensor histidine kinase
VVTLGIVIPEAVAKRYDHAFPGGQSGSIIVSVHRAKKATSRP